MNGASRLPSDFHCLFGSGRAEYLAGIGHDFLEGSRDGALIRAVEGKEYLDCVSSMGIFNLGRSNSNLTHALRDAIHHTDQGNFPLISREKADLAERLARFLPGELDCSVFSVTRGETVDFACKLARAATGRTEILHLQGAYHGETGFALSLSDIPGMDRFGPLLPRVRRVPFSNPERDSSLVTASTAAVFMEAIQVENGCRIMEPEHAQAWARLCRRQGALLVLDETQTGFGRTGTRFAYEALGVDPDVVIVGEALGGGLFPIAATVFRQRLNTFMNAHPMLHLSTFGGSDVGCRVALQALNLYEEIRPWENASTLEKRLGHIAEDLRVQGKGLLWALHLDSPDMAQRFCRSCAQEGILLLPGRIATHTVVIRPPLTITESETSAVFETLKTQKAKLAGLASFSFSANTR